MDKRNSLLDWFLYGVAIVGLISGVSDCVKRERENKKYPSGGYTQEEERIILDYLERQEQFDREYGTGKQDRM